jgi:predicted kinase
MKTLIIVEGQEGAGKSTLLPALLSYVPNAVSIDGEHLGQFSSCNMDDQFFQLLRRNVAALVTNFWDAGHQTVIAGSFLRHLEDYHQFWATLSEDISVYFIHLCASKAVRDERRIQRSKPSEGTWRDQIDRNHPEAVSFADNAAGYHYLRVDNSHLTLEQTIERIAAFWPEIFTA